MKICYSFNYFLIKGEKVKKSLLFVVLLIALFSGCSKVKHAYVSKNYNKKIDNVYPVWTKGNRLQLRADVVKSRYDFSPASISIHERERYLKSFSKLNNELKNNMAEVLKTEFSRRGLTISDAEKAKYILLMKPYEYYARKHISISSFLIEKESKKKVWSSDIQVSTHNQMLLIKLEKEYSKIIEDYTEILIRSLEEKKIIPLLNKGDV